MIQVVLLDERDYINGYKNFNDDDIESMLVFIKRQAVRSSNRVIKLIRFPQLSVSEIEGAFADKK